MARIGWDCSGSATPAGLAMAAPPRSIASLTLSFGLVAIPVKVYSAVRTSERISFNLLRASDGSRVRQQYIAVKDGKTVERSEMTKGYEFAKDQYVMFSPQELKELEDTTTRSIDIQHFVPLGSIDPVYFQATYFLAPDKGGAKPYALLHQALVRSSQCALGRWVSRGKESIVVVRASGSALALQQLHFQSEVRSAKDLAIEEVSVTEPELKLAQQLIEQLAEPRFEAGEYTDDFKARVQAAIERKVQGHDIALAQPPASAESANVIDLMSALKASLAGSAQAADGAERKAPKRAATVTAAKAKRRSRRSA
jgi:DNA end-binding protein Ku